MKTKITTKNEARTYAVSTYNQMISILEGLPKGKARKMLTVIKNDLQRCCILLSSSGLDTKNLQACLNFVNEVRDNLNLDMTEDKKRELEKIEGWEEFMNEPTVMIDGHECFEVDGGYIPVHPEEAYKGKGWKGWDDFLGTKGNK